MSNIILILILAVAVFFAFRSSMKHFKGQGGCCGGGTPDSNEHGKKLHGKILGTKKIFINGMHCQHCRASVENALNKIEHAVSQVNLKKNIATVKYDAPVSDDELRNAVEAAGFSVTEIREA